jgi:uncharacterized protein YndB with AHSA1/START domain
MNKTIRHQIFYGHPAEAVWEYLTKPELLSQWLMPNNFQPVVGHEFQFTTKPIPALDFDGIFYCKVREVLPFNKLSYSWIGGPGDGKISLDSIVIWTLTERDNGTELQVEHSGFKPVENLALYDAMNKGWLQNMHKITDRLNVLKNGTASA